MIIETIYYQATFTRVKVYEPLSIRRQDRHIIVYRRLQYALFRQVSYKIGHRVGLVV